MSLRARLLAGLVFTMLVVLGAGIAVGAIYRSSLTDQLDERLVAYGDRIPAVLARTGLWGGSGLDPGGVADGRPFPGGPPVDQTPGGPPGGLSDVYLGLIETGGALSTLLAPTNDPDLLPALPEEFGKDGFTSGPFTVGDLGGGGGRVRVLAVPTADPTSPVAIVAISMADIERSFERLRATAVVVAAILAIMFGLVAAWVVRLGLRPISEMTEVADAITGGRRDIRAPDFPPATEAARLSGAFNAMIDETQRTEDRLRRFVADASHELRTPLTTLRGYAALYSAGGLVDEAGVADAMRRIGSEATRMGAMVDDLLLLADLDEQRPLERETVDVARLLFGRWVRRESGTTGAASVCQCAAGRWWPDRDR